MSQVCIPIVLAFDPPSNGPEWGASKYEFLLTIGWEELPLVVATSAGVFWGKGKLSHLNGTDFS